MEIESGVNIPFSKINKIDNTPENWRWKMKNNEWFKCKVYTKRLEKNNFLQFSKHDFEEYYPERFKDELDKTLILEHKKNLKQKRF